MYVTGLFGRARARGGDERADAADPVVDTRQRHGHVAAHRDASGHVRSTHLEAVAGPVEDAQAALATRARSRAQD